jgi:hypothetical protein
MPDPIELAYCFRLTESRNGSSEIPSLQVSAEHIRTANQNYQQAAASTPDYKPQHGPRTVEEKNATHQSGFSGLI